MYVTILHYCPSSHWLEVTLSAELKSVTPAFCIKLRNLSRLHRRVLQCCRGQPPPSSTAGTTPGKCNHNVAILSEASEAEHLATGFCGRHCQQWTANDTYASLVSLPDQKLPGTLTSSSHYSLNASLHHRTKREESPSRTTRRKRTIIDRANDCVRNSPVTKYSGQE